MNYIQDICQLLNNSAKKSGIEENLNITFSKREDSLFQCNDAFSLAKKYGLNPLVLAENIVNNIEIDENYQFSVARPAFININLTEKGLLRLANFLAEVVVSGDGDTDLDLYVYDSNGNLIAKDDDYTDGCYVRWRPSWTGRFIIKIVNRGPVYNKYVLMTN